MELHIFNEARERTAPALRAARANPSPHTLADLTITLMMNGLVVQPLSAYPDGIPEPLCAMERWPVEGGTYEIVYLVPADQIDLTTLG